MGGGKPFERSSGTLQRVQQEHMHWDADHGTGLKRRFRLPRVLLKLMLALERKLLSRRERLTASMVASAVFGLQGISSDVPTVRRILAVLSDDLRQSSDHLDGKGIGSALFGMQNMTSKSPQVRELLRCLSEVIDRSNATLNAQATGNAFYGLQGMSSDVEETRLVLLSLTKKMRAAPMRGRHSDYMLTGQNIGNALWGLRNMSIPDQPLQETDDTATTAAALRDVLGEESLSHEASSGSSNSVQVAVGEVVQDEVVLAVEALTERIAESSAQMSGQNIGNAFYALHGMSSTHPAVRRLLAALALKLVASTGELSGLDVGMTLYGLRRMDSTLPEVRVVLGALLHKIRTSPVELQLRDLSMAIVGTLSVTPWVRDDYLRVLSSKLPGMTYLGDDDLEPDDDDDK
jgi:phage gp46-like protein